ncbi:MAG: hypothetical protein ACI4QD_06030 [Kiritimatiellia bacterium]
MKPLFTAALLLAATLQAQHLELDCLATGNDAGVETEFLLIGSSSDRAYEALFVLPDGVETTLWQRVQSLRAPDGRPLAGGSSCDAMDLRFWPKGEHFSLRLFELEPNLREIPLSSVLSDSKHQPLHFSLVASNRWDATEPPVSVISLYNDSQTLFDLPVQASKGATYGRFRTVRKLRKHARYRIRLDWMPATNALPRANEITLEVTPETDYAALVRMLRKEAETGRDLFLRIRPAPNLPVSRLVDLARLIKPLEAPGGVRLDKPAEGQFYLPAFLPRREWRTPSSRPFQPWELHLGATNTLQWIEEDWRVQGLEPKLVPHIFVLDSPERAAEVAARLDNPDKPMHTLLVYCSPDAPAGELLRWIQPLRRQRPLPFVWFFVGDASP